MMWAVIGSVFGYLGISSAIMRDFSSLDASTLSLESYFLSVYLPLLVGFPFSFLAISRDYSVPTELLTNDLDWLLDETPFLTDALLTLALLLTLGGLLGLDL